MPEAKKKKGKRVTTTNIKVTTETHRELQVAAEILDKTQSEVISEALRAFLPNLLEEIRRREEIKRSVAKRTGQTEQ